MVGKTFQTHTVTQLKKGHVSICIQDYLQSLYNTDNYVNCNIVSENANWAYKLKGVQRKKLMKWTEEWWDEFVEKNVEPINKQNWINGNQSWARENTTQIQKRWLT